MPIALEAGLPADLGLQVLIAAARAEATAAERERCRQAVETMWNDQADFEDDHLDASKMRSLTLEALDRDTAGTLPTVSETTSVLPVMPLGAQVEYAIEQLDREVAADEFDLIATPEQEGAIVATDIRSLIDPDSPHTGTSDHAS